MALPQTDIHQFFYTWLGNAVYFAMGSIKDSADMKRFLADAWDAFENKRSQMSSTDFGKKWK